MLDLDTTRANAFPDDYDTDLESDWNIRCNSFSLFPHTPQRFHIDYPVDVNDSSRDTVEKSRNLYQQHITAKHIAAHARDTLALLTAALRIHVNIGQRQVVNTSAVFVSLETVSAHALVNRSVNQIGHSHIRLPPRLHLNNTTDDDTISLRVSAFLSP